MAEPTADESNIRWNIMLDQHRRRYCSPFGVVMADPTADEMLDWMDKHFDEIAVHDGRWYNDVQVTDEYGAVGWELRGECGSIREAIRTAMAKATDPA